MKMTSISKSNLLASDSAQIIAFDAGGYGVKVWRGYSSAFIHAACTIMVYKSPELARRAVRRLRPDLEPTTV